MTAFRILDPFQVYFDLKGQLAAGGNLHFYAAGTTTDADVFGDEALTVNNGAVIAIGSDGRAVDDIWGSGSYRVRVYAADGTLIRDSDNFQLPGAGGLVIPTPVDGDFLTSSSGVLLWAAIRQALDPAGVANKVIGSDGTNLVWVDKPTNGTSGAAGTNAAVTVTASSVKWSSGTGDLAFIQTGTTSAPATGTKNTTANITFPTAYKTTPVVIVIPTVAAQGGVMPIPKLSTINTTGFTVDFGTNDDNAAATFINTCTFQWLAFGTVAT